MSHILIVSTGGTISMTAGGAGLRPSLNAVDLTSGLAPLATLGNIETLSPLQKPGASLSMDDVSAMAALIESELLSGMDGAVVVQGTDTIEEAAFLYDLICRGDKPIVVTGAMRSADMPSADGPANLIAAARVAASPRSRGRGVLVVLNDEIHAAVHVQKSHSTLPSAFTSPLHGPLGLLLENEPCYFHAAPAHRPASTVPRPAAGADFPPIALLPAALGDDGRLLASLPAAGYQGLVVQAMGAGHVPEAYIDALTSLARHMPVVLSSRIGHGITLRTTYGFPGSERDLLERGLISAGLLDSRKARLLLMVLRTAGMDTPQIRQCFDDWQPCGRQG